MRCWQIASFKNIVLRQSSGLLLLCIIFLFPFQSFAQQRDTGIVRLEKLIQTQRDDTNKVVTLVTLAFKCYTGPKETIPLARIYSEKALQLANALKYERGSAKATMMLGMIAYRNGNLDEALNLYQTALQIFLNIRDDKGCGQAYLYLACDYWDKDNTTKAREYFKQAAIYLLKANALKDVGIAYINIGMCYHNDKEYDSALVYYTRALHMQKTLKDTNGIAQSYLKLGILSEEQTKFPDAIDNYYRAATMLQKTGNWEARTDALSVLGYLYFQLGKYRQARKYLLIAEKEATESGSVISLPKVQVALAETYLKLQDTTAAKREIKKGISMLKNNTNSPNYPKFLTLRADCEKDNQKAIKDYYEAFNLIRQEDQKIEEFSVLYKIAMRKLNSSDTSGVMAILNNAYKLAVKRNSFLYFRNYYFVISRYYETTGNYKAALAEYHNYMAYDDSVNKQDFIKKLSVENAKYDAETKELEIKTLQQDQKIATLQLRQSSQKRKYLTAGGCIILILIMFSGILLYQWQQQKKEKDLLAMQTEERLRIAHDMHDDIGAGLTKISVTAQLSQLKAEGNEAVKDLQQITTISHELIQNMRDLIWMLQPENATLENLTVRIREFCTYFTEGKEIKLMVDFPESLPEISFGSKVQRNIFLTVKEAIHNVYKHASACELRLSLVLKEENLSITIADNGKGFENSSDLSKGNGLKNMARRIHNIGGEFSLKTATGAGTEIHILVPLSAGAA